MSKILFDTNVLIASLLTKGACFEIIKDALIRHDIYYTLYIIKEIQRKQKTKKLKSLNLNFIIPYIKQTFIKGVSAKDIQDICRDKKDNYILADALENKIDYLITGDKDLLILKNHKNMKIITPSNYWNI